MRNAKRFWLAAAALLAVQAAPLHAQDEPSYSLINAGASRIDFADEHARMGKNGFVSFSILTVLAASNVAYALSEVSINCNASQIATLSNVNYAANGGALPTEAVDSAAQPIAPGTLGQALKGVICAGVDPFPRSKPVKGIAAAVAKAHDLMTALKAAQAK